MAQDLHGMIIGFEEAENFFKHGRYKEAEKEICEIMELYEEVEVHNGNVDIINDIVSKSQNLMLSIKRYRKIYNIKICSLIFIAICICLYFIYKR